jgi:hypothetical protein
LLVNLWPDLAVHRFAFFRYRFRFRSQEESLRAGLIGMAKQEEPIRRFETLPGMGWIGRQPFLRKARHAEALSSWLALQGNSYALRQGSRISDLRLEIVSILDCGLVIVSIAG